TRRDLRRSEVLARAEDRLAVADDERSAAQGVRYPVPLRVEREPHSDLDPDRSLRRQSSRPGPPRLEHRTPRRNRRRAGRRRDLRHDSDEIGVRHRSGKWTEYCLDRSGGWCLGPPGGGENRNAVRALELVEV